MRRRVLRRPADPRARRGLVRARVPGVRLSRSRGRASGSQILDETLEVDQAALDRGDRRPTRASTSRSTARTATRSRSSSCPRSGSAAAASRSRCASRRATPTRPTGRSASTRSCTSRSCSRSTATRSAATSTRSCARTAPTAVVFDTEADLQAWLDSPGGGSLWGRGRRTTSTSATTSSAPPSRWPRRCRRTSTRAVASSCSGSATSRSPTSLEAFARDVVPAGHAS